MAGKAIADRYRQLLPDIPADTVNTLNTRAHTDNGFPSTAVPC